MGLAPSQSRCEAVFTGRDSVPVPLLTVHLDGPFTKWDRHRDIDRKAAARLDFARSQSHFVNYS